MIEWIDDQLGTAAYGSLSPADLSRYSVLDVRVLVDGAGNHTRDLQQAIDDCVRLLSRNKPLVIACDMGLSRSRAVALGVLVTLGWTFERALPVAKDNSGRVLVDMGLLYSVADLLGKSTNVQKDRLAMLLAPSDFRGIALSRALNRTIRLDVVPDAADYAMTQLSELIFSESFQSTSCILFMLTPTSRHSTWALAQHLQRLKNTLELARYTSKRLIYLSSLSLFNGYADLDTDEAFVASDDCLPLPHGTYAETQFLAEALINIYRRNYELNATIVRVPEIYGTGMEPHALLRKMTHLAVEGAPLITHQFLNGLPRVEFVHVNDFAAAVRLLAAAGHGAETYHVGTGVAHTTADIAAMIAERVGSGSSLGFRQIDRVVRNVVSAHPSSIASLGWHAETTFEDGLDSLIEESRSQSAVRDM